MGTVVSLKKREEKCELTEQNVNFLNIMSSDLTQLSLVKMFALDQPEQDLDLIQSANAGNDDRRVQQLRQLLLSQLDLIQKQSEVIVAKDQQLKELKNENETLIIKVGGLSTPATEKTSTVTQEKTKKIKTTVKVESIEEEEKPEDHVEEMETDEPYYTLQNETIFQKSVPDNEQKVIEKKPEVPGWRLNPISPSYIMEGTEDIENETMLKRHQKPENDERRRKRWDVQRIREQRHVAHLREKYDPREDHVITNLSSKLMPLNAESSKDFSSLTTLLPDPDEADEIVVQEKLPVSVFGCVLPNLGVNDFSLPWLS